MSAQEEVLGTPVNNLVNPMLTDLYQLTMAYGYWKQGIHEKPAVFDLFFRSNPFGGEFTVFAGLEEVLKFVKNFRFTEENIAYIKNELMPGCDKEFFEWLRRVDCSDIKLHAAKEGSVVFPRVPLIRVEGPLAVAQILETALLNLVNYSSLVATNAARFRLAAGRDKKLLEFGLRRAQGPDGGVTASRCSYIGGFDATSNVLAGEAFGVPVAGTHAHSFVTAFSGMDDLSNCYIEHAEDDGPPICLLDVVNRYRELLGFTNTHNGELAAFTAYAQAFPDKFLALIDTYDTLKSGAQNFICVALALQSAGYKPLGIRLDSGDLAYLSKEVRRMFDEVGQKLGVDTSGWKIAVSNDINEETLYSLNHQEHAIDIFGVGTHLVTCQAQPALGCVYKLVETGGSSHIKLSENIEKTTIPGRKKVYRLYSEDGTPVVDLMVLASEDQPEVGKRVLCRHPFEEAKRIYVVPSKVVPLLNCVWSGGLTTYMPTIQEVRGYALEGIYSMREDHMRKLNPTPYKVAVSEKLYNSLHELWMQEAPIEEIR